MLASTYDDLCYGKPNLHHLGKLFGAATHLRAMPA